MNAAMTAAQMNPEIQNKLKQMGADVVINTPEEFGAFIQAESNKWEKIIKEAKIKPQ